MRYLVFLFLCLATVAQGQQRFYKLYAGNGFDKGEDILVLPDSSFVVAGSSGSFEQTAQGYLLKLDQQGNYQSSISQKQSRLKIQMGLTQCASERFGIQITAHHQKNLDC